MAHGENAESCGHVGKEFWKSRLSRWGDLRGKITKQLNHRKERAEARRIEQKLLKQHIDDLQ